MSRLLILLPPMLLALANATSAAASTLELSLRDDGTLSVDLEDAPLDGVLGALGAALEVEVVIEGALPDTVSARFEGVAPARAVRRLVGARPLLMRWTPGGALGSIRVRGAPSVADQADGEARAHAEPGAALGRIEAPVADPPDEIDAASAQRLERQLAHRVRRMRADWQRLPGSADAGDLAGQLAQDDPFARRAAIQALARQGDGAAAGLLGEVLETETEPVLRRMALGALAGIDHPLARGLLEAALE